ncbi:hypothetical protein N0V93_002543 [Gnomoniopsis smithogilvyi]|uniref:Protein kinase domain-containing protein n=1 Tax=Gnomoniopsis smithogilvyi TaxID=1191159 RepID=A0A9W8YZ09_9PEZI|nr:hypothetical protein N0V93_002543 [Gnomoniopsis smithogilvyi]
MPSSDQALKRLDGKSDLWAPPYQLAPAGLLKYSSTELDPYVKITDIGGAIHVDEPPPDKVVTHTENRAPEIHLGLSASIGPGVDIWSFGCLAFLVITGDYLFMPGFLVGSEEAVGDMHLIQFSQADGKTRRSETLVDGEDGTWDFMDTNDDDDIDSNSESGEEGEEKDDEEGGGGFSNRRNQVELLEADHYEGDAGSGMSGAWPSVSTATDEEEPLIIMAPCRSLEERFADKKPHDVDGVEEQQIVHLLCWIFQYDPTARPTAEEILNRPWFQTMGQDVVP